MAARFVGDLTLEKNSVEDQHFSATNGKQLTVAKQYHIHVAATNFDLAVGGTPVTREEDVHVATVAGRIRSFKATLRDTGTTTVITFDVKKNGTTMLTGEISFTEADADGLVKEGTFSDAEIAVDDVISIAMTVTSATGAVGPIAQIEIEQDGASV